MIANLIIDIPDHSFLIMPKFFLATFPGPIVTVPQDRDVEKDEQRLDKSKQLKQLLHTHKLLNKLTKLLNRTTKLL